MRWFVVCLGLLCGCLPAPVAAASTLTITAPQANVRAGPGLTSQVLMAVQFILQGVEETVIRLLHQFR